MWPGSHRNLLTVHLHIWDITIFVVSQLYATSTWRVIVRALLSLPFRPPTTIHTPNIAPSMNAGMMNACHMMSLIEGCVCVCVVSQINIAHKQHDTQSRTEGPSLRLHHRLEACSTKQRYHSKGAAGMTNKLKPKKHCSYTPVLSPPAKWIIIICLVIVMTTTSPVTTSALPLHIRLLCT